MIHVVIPHHGSDDILTRCTDAVAAACDGMDATIDVVQSSGRLFTETVNEGLRRARGAEFIWLLNNDAAPDKLCAVAALAQMQAHPLVGIVGCQNRSFADPERATWAGSGAYFPAGRHKVGPVSAFTFSRELWVPFSCVFLRGSMVEEIGLLDRRLRHICSDSDYCIRARNAGWQVWHNPDAWCLHDFGSSASANTTIEKTKRMDIEIFKRKHKLTIDAEHGIAR